MKTAVILLACFGFALPAAAQIKVALEMEHGVYLRYQPTTLRVTVVNRGARPINFREIGGSAQIKLVVIDSQKRKVERTGNPLFEGLFIVYPQESKTQSIDLFPAFKIGKVENYHVTAYFTFGSRRFASEPAFFQVHEGATVDKLELLTPPRTFKLLRADRQRGQYLCLGVFSPREDLAYGMFELGRLVQGREPQIELDGNRQVHVLHASAPDRYVHSTFTDEGRPVDQELHLTEFGEARLRVNREGTARILGTRAVP